MMTVEGINGQLAKMPELKLEAKNNRIDFKELLDNSLNQINETEKTANDYGRMLASGEIENIHDAMIAAQKAEITLSFALQVRKEVLSAYQELMRLQV